MMQRAAWQMLLQTRLHPPYIPADVVDRPRLDELLAKVFQHKVTLVAAPAGYGKTTAVALWARAQPDPVAWVSLGTPPGELFLFVSYLVAALQRVGGGFPETELLVRSGQAPAAILRRSLVAELAALGRTMVVVLDDYDRVCCEPIHEFVAALVEELPPSVHLLMTVRARPQLVLARWRERQELLEVRASDLCCDTAETGQLLLAMRGTPLDAAVVQVLHDRTEGWAAGVRLAALSMQRVSPEQLAATLKEASTVNVRDYLLDEVFALQSEQTQQFLVRTSILERFCAPLCAAVLAEGAVDGAVDGAAVEASCSWIAALADAGLFVISLDEVNEWYRYHHLFAELLRVRLHQQLDRQTVARLHQRAGEWHARHGLIEEAVRHFLACGDVEAAVRVVADHAQPGLDREDWPLVERWLALLPEPAVQRDPALLLARALCTHLRMDLAQLQPLAQRIDALLQGMAEGDVKNMLCTVADLLSATVCFHQNALTAMLEPSERAWNRSVGLTGYVHGLSGFYRAMGLQASGRFAEAEQWLGELLRGPYAGIDSASLRLRFALVGLYRMDGDLWKGQAAAQTLLADSLSGRFRLMECWARALLGTTAYEQGDLPAAAGHFASGAELMFIANAAAVRECLAGLCLTQINQQRLVEAAASLERMREFRKGDPDKLVESLSARLALANGDGERALRWARAVEPGETPPWLYWLEVPLLSAARILMASEQPDLLERSRYLLQQVAQWARRSHCRWRTLEVAVLQAIVCEKLARAFQARAVAGTTSVALHQEALERLRYAIPVAVPLGFRQFFRDCPPQLLKQLAEEPDLALWIDLIFEKTLQKGPTQAKKERAAARPATFGLSLREQQIIALLAQGLTNRQIAERILLSPHTIRNYIVDICNKLGVDTRQEVVAQSLQLGIVAADLSDPKRPNG
jgi:LuxR family transcriptional regulator, maltose regulon positive regulatory protein